MRPTRPSTPWLEQRRSQWVEGHDNNNNPLRRIKVRVADETSTAVAGQKDTFTIAVINSAPSDSHRRSGNRPFPCHFYRRDSSPRRRAVGLQIAHELQKRMLLQRFHLRFDSTNFRTLARCMSRTPVCAAGFRKQLDLILRSRIS